MNNVHDSQEKQGLSDIKETLTNTEALLQKAARSTGTQAEELRAKAAALLDQAKKKAGDLQDQVTIKGRQAIDATDDYVHEKPWTSIGIGVTVGFLVGLLVGRR